MEQQDRDYVLGTHDEEIERLGLQHRVWRERVLDAWNRAGFGPGQTLLDVGCGPGYASVDLARIVGPGGRVLAVDRSRRFLDALESASARLELRNIVTFERDLDLDPLPDERADGAWCRWVLAFVQRPRDLVSRLHAALEPGATLVAHEYFDYSTWRLAPRCEAFEAFVRAVIRSWRASGGEPDVGLELPDWLSRSGFRVRETRPRIDVIAPSEFAWQWCKAFFDVGLPRLVELGTITAPDAERMRSAFEEREATAGTLMVTPAVLEVIAERI